jgi:hypothetical protein
MRCRAVLATLRDPAWQADEIRQFLNCFWREHGTLSLTGTIPVRHCLRVLNPIDGANLEKDGTVPAETNGQVADGDYDALLLLTAFLLMYRSPSSDLNAPLQKKRKESSRVRRCPSSRNAMNCKVYYSSVAMDLDLAHAECMGARCRWYFVSSVDPLLPSEATHGRRDHARARRDTASARAPTGDRDAILTPCGRRRGRRGGGRGRA